MYGVGTIGTGPVSVWRALSIRLRRGLAARSAAGQSVGVRAGIGIGFGSVIAARGRVSVFLSECGAGRGSRISKSSCRPALRRKNGCGVCLRTARAVRCRGRSRDWSEPELGPGPEEGPIRWFGRSGRSVAPLRMRTAKRPTLGRRIGRLVRRNDGRYLAVMVCPLIST